MKMMIVLHHHWSVMTQMMMTSPALTMKKQKMKKMNSLCDPTSKIPTPKVTTVTLKMMKTKMMISAQSNDDNEEISMEDAKEDLEEEPPKVTRLGQTTQPPKDLIPTVKGNEHECEQCCANVTMHCMT